jgi:hypothetical protein
MANDLAVEAAMRRLKAYFRFIAWTLGLGYIVLWLATVLTLDHGATVFGDLGACAPDTAKVLFYWNCNPASPSAFLSAIANTALTVTVWAPVYVAAATVRPDAIMLALPIVLTHAIGLPAALYVAIRLMLELLALARRLRRGGLVPPPADASTPAAVAAPPPAIETRRPAPVPPRQTFGLRTLR